MEVSKEKVKQHYSMKMTEPVHLRPYRKEHVPMYNQWMGDETLCRLTSSQHLSLEEEYECQRNWTTDPTRDTFLVFYGNEPIGDVNCFFSPWLEEDEGEINVMIVTEQYRGRGIGRMVVEAIEDYSRALKNRTVMIARIKEDNASSLALFRRLGYEEVGFNEKEKEFEFRKRMQKMEWGEFVVKYRVVEEEMG